MSLNVAFAGNAVVGAALKESLVKSGYTFVGAPSDAQLIFTYFPLLSALEDAYFDEKGILVNASKGAMVVDLSPATPELAREISAVASVSDLLFVEAPLAVCDTTLADAFADPSNLKCWMAAGDRSTAEKAAETLGCFVAGGIEVLDEAGAAQLAHAAWSLQHAAQILAAIESEALYRAMLHIPTSAAASSSIPAITSDAVQEAVVKAVAEKRFTGTYTIEMFMADLSAALTTADDADLILPQAEACMNLLELLAIIGGSDMAPAALALIYDEEQAAAEAGLDWTRSEEYTRDMGAHDHEHLHGDDDDDDDFGGYTDLFGDYSDN